MPVILENGSDQIRNWLDPNQSEWSKELQSLLRPFDGELECYAVSKEVGKVGNNSPTFIVPVASTENKNNIANFFPSTEKAAAKSETRNKVQTEYGGEVRKGMQLNEIQGEESNAEESASLNFPASTSVGTTGLKRRHEAETHDIKLSKIQEHPTPTISPEKTPAKKSRSAISNGTKGRAVRLDDGSQRITNFFNK